MNYWRHEHEIAFDTFMKVANDLTFKTEHPDASQEIKRCVNKIRLALKDPSQIGFPTEENLIVDSLDN